MIKPLLFVFTATALAGCGTVIDFGPEPGTPGDPGYWHYQPELHGPNAPPRDPPPDGFRIGESNDAEAAGQPSAPPAPASATASQSPGAATAPPAPVAPGAVPALPAPPPPSAAPPAPVSETMFNDAIRRAVAAGEIDRALRLLEEAERLGSQSARPAFIDAIEGAGQD